jgi:hypothetical protein
LDHHPRKDYEGEGMKPHVQKAVHVASTVVFALAFLMSTVLFCYGWIVFQGDSGSGFTDLLDKILQKRESTSALFGALLTALPATCLTLANTKAGKLTPRGRLYLFFLIPLWIVAALANILIESYEGVAGGQELAKSADTFALSIFTYATTFLTAIFGLNAGVGNDKPI